MKAGGELAPKIRQTTWVHGDVLLDSGCFFFFRRWINRLLCGSWKGAMCFHNREWFGGISRIYVDNRTFDCSSMRAIVEWCWKVTMVKLWTVFILTWIIEVFEDSCWRGHAVHDFWWITIPTIINILYFYLFSLLISTDFYSICFLYFKWVFLGGGPTISVAGFPADSGHLRSQGGGRSPGSERGNEGEIWQEGEWWKHSKNGNQGNPQPSCLVVISYNPYFGV